MNELQVIGIIGNKELAINITERSKKLLADNLMIELNDDKTKITQIVSDKIKFLGLGFHRNVSKI